MNSDQNIEKILLIIPSYYHAKINQFTQNNVAPFGCLSLVSYIEFYFPHIKCKIVDLNLYSHDEHQTILINTLKDFVPQIVCLSLMYNACLYNIDVLSAEIKKHNQNIYLLAGGILPTNLPEDIFNKTNLIDGICHGEGEVPLRDFIESKDRYGLLKEHPSWITPDAHKSGKKGKATYVENLDDIPPIRYCHININAYSSRINDPKGKLTLPIHSTRGCPYNCIFCTSAANHGRKLRYMSANRFLSDVRQMINEYGIKKISIDDDQFLFNRERSVEILRGLQKLNIEVELANGLSVRHIDEEIAELLKAAGVKIAVLAVESGSQNVLKNIIDKPLNVDEVEKSVVYLRGVGLLVHSFFMIGLPNETDYDRELTRQLMLNVGFDWCNIAIATPYKGSRLYDLCKKNDYLLTDDFDLDIYSCKIKAPGVEPEQINRDAYLLNLDVNFVNNYNFKTGRYDIAKQYFERIANRYKEHAFAHYFLARVMEKMGGGAQNHYKIFSEILSKDKSWSDYAIHFGIVK
jgi:radical SAM superfamily enzyme YgiQ (UPF0313 family)